MRVIKSYRIILLVILNKEDYKWIKKLNTQKFLYRIHGKVKNMKKKLWI